MNFTLKQAQDILKDSQILYDTQDLQREISRIACAVNEDMKTHTELPLFLTVMNGGLFFTANLLSQIQSPFILDYIHASRYGDLTHGSNHIIWYRQPSPELVRGKNIYIIDDILDEGYTLAELQRFLTNVGAKSCKIIVLIDKNIGKDKPVKADYIGLTSPNHFLFGYGMDIHGLYRQLPQIYMYNPHDSQNT